MSSDSGLDTTEEDQAPLVGRYVLRAGPEVFRSNDAESAAHTILLTNRVPVPPVGMPGTYGDTEGDTLIPRGAIVVGHAGEQVDIIFYRWGTWVPATVPLADRLTAGAWCYL